MLRFFIIPLTMCNATVPLAVKQPQMMPPPPCLGVGTVFLCTSGHFGQTTHFFPQTFQKILDLILRLFYIWLLREWLKRKAIRWAPPKKTQNKTKKELAWQCLVLLTQIQIVVWFSSGQLCPVLLPGCHRVWQKLLTNATWVQLQKEKTLYGPTEVYLEYQVRHCLSNGSVNKPLVSVRTLSHSYALVSKGWFSEAPSGEENSVISKWTTLSSKWRR